MPFVIAPSISYTVAEERIRRQRGREKPSADVLGMRYERASKWALAGCGKTQKTKRMLDYVA